MEFAPIRSTEYEAWARLNRVKITPAELQLLKRIDRANVAMKNQQEGPPPPREPGSFIKQLAELVPDKVQKQKGKKT